METTQIIIGELTKHTNSVNLTWEVPNGGEGEVEGELYYNKKEERYEHTATGPDGKEYLIVGK